MDFNKMFFGGAIIGTLVTFWNTIKSVAWKLCTIVLKKVDLDGQLDVEFLNYARENFKYIYLHDRKYLTLSYWTKANRRHELTAWESFENSSILFFKGRIPFYFSKSSKVEKTKDSPDETKVNTTVYYLRGTLNIEEIIKKSVERKNNINKQHLIRTENDHSRFYLKYVPGNISNEKYDVSYDFHSSARVAISHNVDELGFFSDRKSLDRLVLTNENREIIELTTLWKNNKDWYTNRDIPIPWKLGLLLTGVPGSGKTSTARAIAEHLNIPIFVYRLGMLNDEEFMDEWSKMQAHTPCMALMEDFDNVFHGRTNIAAADSFLDAIPLINKKDDKDSDEVIKKGRGRRLTFDNFLNTLDGVERYEGVLTIITTNCIDKVDEALINRPGRIDHVVEFTYLTEENKLVMIDKICVGMPAARSAALEYVRSTSEPLTPAQLQQKCIELCLHEFYNTRKGLYHA